MSGPFPGSGECRAADDEGPFAREDVQERLVCGVENLVAMVGQLLFKFKGWGRDGQDKAVLPHMKDMNHLPPDVMHIVLYHTIPMRRIGGHSMHSQVSLNIIDDIWRMINVPHSRGRCGT